jgi:hypothetical protein
MKKTIILFDMDGVLLRPLGYHTSLQTSIQRIGAALGAPNTRLHPDQIAKFEALSVTNEWDSLAICTALTLIYLWKINSSVRLDGLAPRGETLSSDTPAFDNFLSTFHSVGHEPGHAAYHQLLEAHSWLNNAQKKHLSAILHHSREIYVSLTLPGYQETVLGSKTFESHYGLKPQLEIESFLSKYDQPIMDKTQYTALQKWLATPDHLAGILTNRPSACPSGYLSSPEAELGEQCISLQDLPLLGSGMLAWFASTQLHFPDYVFLKPHPVHSLGLLQIILGRPANTALENAYALTKGHGQRSDWTVLEDAKIIVFEDSAKGLACAIAAREALMTIGTKVKLNLVGVTTNPDKTSALQPLANQIIPDINHVQWEDL